MEECAVGVHAVMLKQSRPETSPDLEIDRYAKQLLMRYQAQVSSTTRGIALQR